MFFCRNFWCKILFSNSLSIQLHFCLVISDSFLSERVIFKPCYVKTNYLAVDKNEVTELGGRRDLALTR